MLLFVQYLTCQYIPKFPETIHCKFLLYIYWICHQLLSEKFLVFWNIFIKEPCRCQYYTMVIREILNKALHIYKRLIALTVEMTYDYHIVRQDFIITFVLYLWLFLSLCSSTQRNNPFSRFFTFQKTSVDLQSNSCRSFHFISRQELGFQGHNMGLLRNFTEYCYMLLVLYIFQVWVLGSPFSVLYNKELFFPVFLLSCTR